MSLLNRLKQCLMKDEMKFSPSAFHVTQPANENKGQHVIFIRFLFRGASDAVTPVSAPVMHGLGGWMC